jgi:hypothetical protein
MLRELNTDEIDAVAGGMINNGQGQFLPKSPGALPGRGENGAPDGKSPIAYLIQDALLLAPLAFLIP